jgi:uncharacterized protein YxjI
MITDTGHQEDFYRIRKKVLTIGSKYWIEDSAGKVLGFCKQKLLRLKEEIWNQKL